MGLTGPQTINSNDNSGQKQEVVKRQEEKESGENMFPFLPF
jgi:hypothetical protein